MEGYSIIVRNSAGEMKAKITEELADRLVADASGKFSTKGTKKVFEFTEDYALEYNRELRLLLWAGDYFHKG